MKDYRIEVHITPRPGLLDPEGKAIQNALRSLDFNGIEDVRVGRLVQLLLHADSKADARTHADAMCRQLLANPVTEDYEFTLEKVK